jgi:hypothetical protein
MLDSKYIAIHVTPPDLKVSRVTEFCVRRICLFFYIVRASKTVLSCPCFKGLYSL